VTSFFRESGGRGGRAQERPFPAIWWRRIRPRWGAACTGVEMARPGRKPTPWPYLQEAWPRRSRAGAFSLHNFATDLDKDSVDRARPGCLSGQHCWRRFGERLRRFFVGGKARVSVGKQNREMLLFAPHNLLEWTRPSPARLLSCRNLLIYLAPELQRNCCHCLNYSLNPGGVLFLWQPEDHMRGHRPFFAPLDGKTRIFGVWKRSANRTGRLPHLGLARVPPWDCRVGWADRRAQDRAQPAALAEQLLLQRHVPAAVLTNDTGDILFISGTGAHTWSQQRQSQLEHYAMAREGLRHEA